MIEILDYAVPGIDHFELAIRGMRSPFKGQNKVDSYYDEDEGLYVIGEDDMRVAKNLINFGSPHQKFLRQLPVTLEIRAPLYWWKQMDQYKIGTTTDSESTMHTITKFPFETDQFSTDWIFDFNDEEIDEDAVPERVLHDVLYALNLYRNLYKQTKDERYWHLINDLLPQSYMQTRTWTGNYATLYEICRQRAHHKLDNEWSVFIQFVLDNMPCFSDFCYDKLCKEDKNFSEKYDQ